MIRKLTQDGLAIYSNPATVKEMLAVARKEIKKLDGGPGIALQFTPLKAYIIALDSEPRHLWDVPTDRAYRCWEIIASLLDKGRGVSEKGFWKELNIWLQTAWSEENSAIDQQTRQMAEVLAR